MARRRLPGARAHAEARRAHPRHAGRSNSVAGSARRALELWALAVGAAARRAVRVLQRAPRLAVVRLQRHLDGERCDAAVDPADRRWPSARWCCWSRSSTSSCSSRAASARAARAVDRGAAHSSNDAMDALITTLLIVALFVLLGSGVWIGLALAGVAWIGMELFSSRPAGDAMAVTIWGSASSWTLTALPLFVWMGEILFRTRLSEDMFRGLAPWLERVPGRLLHTNIIGCTIFAAGVGLVGRDLRDDRQDDAARAARARLSRGHHDRLARRRRHARPPDPAVDHHDRVRRRGERVDRAAVHRRRAPGHPAGGAVLRLHRRVGARCIRRQVPAITERTTLVAEAPRVAPPDSGDAADRRRAGIDLRGHRDRHRGRRVRRRRRARHLRSAGLAHPADVHATA